MNHKFHVFAHEDPMNLAVPDDPPIEIAADASLDEGAIIRTVAPYDTMASRTQYFLGLEGHEVEVLQHALSLLMPAGEQYSEDITWLSSRLGRITQHIAEAKAAAEEAKATRNTDGVLADVARYGADLGYAMRVLMTTAAIRRAKCEVLHDMCEGKVPWTCGSFSELHDYVDANEYGGLCDTYAFTLDDEDPHEFGNAVQGAIDQWLKAGRPIPTARLQVGFKLEEAR